MASSHTSSVSPMDLKPIYKKFGHMFTSKVEFLEFFLDSQDGTAEIIHEQKLSAHQADANAEHSEEYDDRGQEAHDHDGSLSVQSQSTKDELSVAQSTSSVRFNLFPSHNSEFGGNRAHNGSVANARSTMRQQSPIRTPEELQNLSRSFQHAKRRVAASASDLIVPPGLGIVIPEDKDLYEANETQNEMLTSYQPPCSEQNDALPSTMPEGASPAHRPYGPDLEVNAHVNFNAHEGAPNLSISEDNFQLSPEAKLVCLEGEQADAGGAAPTSSTFSPNKHEDDNPGAEIKLLEGADGKHALIHGTVFDFQTQTAFFLSESPYYCIFDERAQRKHTELHSNEGFNPSTTFKYPFLACGAAKNDQMPYDGNGRGVLRNYHYRRKFNVQQPFSMPVHHQRSTMCVSHLNPV